MKISFDLASMTRDRHGKQKRKVKQKHRPYKMQNSWVASVRELGITFQEPEIAVQFTQYSEFVNI